MEWIDPMIEERINEVEKQIRSNESYIEEKELLNQFYSKLSNEDHMELESIINAMFTAVEDVSYRFGLKDGIQLGDEMRKMLSKDGMKD